MNPAQKSSPMQYQIITWLKNQKTHLVVWSIFIIYETIIIGILFNLFGNPITYFLHYLVIIPLFYLHAEIAMPWAFKIKNRAIFRLPIIVAVQIVIYVLSHFAVDLFLIAIKVIPIKEPFKLNSTFILRNLYRGFFFMGFSSGYYFLRTYLLERKRTVELEKQRLNAIIKQKSIEQELFKSQNAFLKAQINPHFLFNTLNFIYNKVSVSSPEAAEAVMSLSEMMNYAITSDQNGGKISLGDELEQVTNLINLFKLRQGRPINLELYFDENVKSLEFIPLVALTLAENMLKHGQLHEPNHPASLKTFIKDNILYFQTRNLCGIPNYNHHHTGLANIKDRLNYAYGDQISFHYATDTDQYFMLRLGVPLGAIKRARSVSSCLYKN